MTTKQEFLQQKINNFIIFIASKIGRQNKIFTEFERYKTDINLFLQQIVQLSSFASKDKTFPPDLIQKYLDSNGIQIKLAEEDFIKLNRYFNCFLQIIDS